MSDDTLLEEAESRDGLSIRALRARIALLEGAQEKLAMNLRQLVTYGRWQVGPESISHHPTLPSAVAQAAHVLEECGLDKPPYARSTLQSEGEG